MTGNMEPDIDKLFRQFIGNILKWLFAALIIFIIIYTLTGCKLFKESKSSDSVNLSKITEGKSKVDSNGNTKEKEYLKETFIYPKGDTIINNFYPPNSPTVYIRETGKEKEQSVQLVRDDSWKNAVDSLKALITSKETTVKAGPSLIEWILIGGLALLLVKNFLPFQFIKK